MTNLLEVFLESLKCAGLDTKIGLLTLGLRHFDLLFTVPIQTLQCNERSLELDPQFSRIRLKSLIFFRALFCVSVSMSDGFSFVCSFFSRVKYP